MAAGLREWTIGVDAGGTKVAAGAVDLASGTVVHRREIETRPERGASMVLEDIATLVEAVAADLHRDELFAHGIGIGIPELVDAEGQIRSAYLLDWATLSLAGRLQAIGPVRFASDVRAAAAAEARFGSGRPYRLFIYVSVGTGISSTLVQDGVPLAGARGGAVVLSTAPISVPCAACGDWSEFVLEDFASGQALARRYLEASGRDVENAQQVVLAAANGDRDAIAVVESAGRALGSAVAWLINVFDPEAAIIGGGLGLSGGRFWDCLTRATRSHIWNEDARGLPIITASLGADAGVIGAALATAPTPPIVIPPLSVIPTKEGSRHKDYALSHEPSFLANARNDKGERSE